MIIEPGPSILPEIGCNLTADGTPVGGRDGLHLSEVIHYYLTSKKNVVLGPYGQLDEAARQVTEQGWVWERLLAMLAIERQDIWGLIFQEAWKHRRLEVDRLQGKQVMQAHLRLDGISMTPDGLDVTGPKPILLEDKHTRKSSRKSGLCLLTDEPLCQTPKCLGTRPCAEHPNPTPLQGFLENFIGWLLQMSGYAHAWSVQLGEPVLEARLRVFWAAGDYSYREGCGAQGKCYIIRFNEAELGATWRMILDLASEMLRLRIAPVAAMSAPVAVEADQQ